MLKFHKYRQGVNDYDPKTHMLTDNWDPNKDYGTEYIYVCFNINAKHYQYPYTEYPGYEEDKAAFHEELKNIFIPLGWTVKSYGGHMISPTITKDEGKSEMYLHPQQMSGILKKNDIGKTAEALDGAKTFKLGYTELRETYYDISDEEYQKMLEKKRKGAAKYAFEISKTKRSDRYIDRQSVITDTANNIHFNRVYAGAFDLRFHPSKEEVQFVGKIVYDMVQEGYLKEVLINDNLYVRSLNKTELKEKVKKENIKTA